jgi:hypothetical protein
VQNEALFRAINEQVLSLEERFGNPNGAFLCECADTGCLEKVFLHLDEYARIHAEDLRFFVVPGHERAENETVLERHPDYLVVEKKRPIQI